MLFVLGLLGLWLGSVQAVRGGSSIALHYRISPAFVGLTLLSVGTSIPEISVSVAGGIDRLGGVETSGVVVGSCVGSAINQLSVLLGIVAVFGSLRVKATRLNREGGMLVATVLVLGALGYDGMLSRIDGVTMLLLYAAYLVNLLREERATQPAAGRRSAMSPFLDALSLGGGLLLVGFSSNVVLDGALALANLLGWSQVFIGIFLVGLGTGLPELAVSLAALRHGQSEMSISNLLGSNLCDLLFALGTGTVVAGFVMPRNVVLFDLPSLLAITALVVVLLGRGLARREGAALIAAYFAYLGLRLAAFG